MNGPPLLPAGLAHARGSTCVTRGGGCACALAPATAAAAFLHETQETPFKPGMPPTGRSPRQADLPRGQIPARTIRSDGQQASGRKALAQDILCALWQKPPEGIDEAENFVGCPALPLRRGMQLPCMPLQGGNIPAKGRDRPDLVGMYAYDNFDF